MTSECMFQHLLGFVAFQSLSCVWLFETPWTIACQPSLFFTISQSFLKSRFNEFVTPSNHLILCCLLLLLPSIFPSIRVFSSDSALRIRCPKYWSFSFSISPSHKYSGLISFRMDWLDLLAIQWTLKSLLQHHSPNSKKCRIIWFWLCPLGFPSVGGARHLKIVILVKYLSC